TLRDELPREVAPCFRRDFPARAVNGQSVVPAAQHAVRARATQYADDLRWSEALARPLHTGEELLRRVGDIRPFDRAPGRAAVVATTAARVGLFAEVAEQRSAPAAGGFGITNHGVETRLASGALGSGPRVNEAAEDAGVRAAVEQ